jgi:hypothetical protein
MGFNLAVRRLLQKQLIYAQELWSEDGDKDCDGFAVADAGWQWIDANEGQFILVRSDKKKDELPF